MSIENRSDSEDRKFSVTIEVEWKGYSMDEATLEVYIKQLLENSGAIRVAYIGVAKVDEFEYGMGDEWGRR